jgi:hypothetical protein
MNTSFVVVEQMYQKIAGRGTVMFFPENGRRDLSLFDRDRGLDVTREDNKWESAADNSALYTKNIFTEACYSANYVI